MEMKRKCNATGRPGLAWDHKHRLVQEATSEDMGSPIPKRPRTGEPATCGKNMGTFVEAVAGGGHDMDRMGELWGEIEKTVQGMEVTLDTATRLGESRTGSTGDTVAKDNAAVVGRGRDVAEDYCLKLGMVIQSENSLEWIRRLGASAHVNALGSFVNPFTNSNMSKNEGSRTEAELNFEKGLLHWRHPAESASTMVASQWQTLISETAGLATSRLSERKKMALARVDAWHAALKSLFYSYRYGKVDCFYVLLSTTTIRFGKVDAPDQEQMQAILSRATMGLRDILSDHCVQYTAIDVDEGEPLISVDGSQYLQALFNCLLSYGPRIANASDVPLLISDCGFAGGTIASLTVESVRRTQSGTATDSGVQYSAKVQGIMTPRQVSQLCHSLKILQNGQYSAYFTPERRGTRLNVCVRGGKRVVPAPSVSRPFAFASNDKGGAGNNENEKMCAHNPFGLGVLVRVECDKLGFTSYAG